MVFLKEKEDEHFEKNVFIYLIKYAFPLKSNQVRNDFFLICVFDYLSLYDLNKFISHFLHSHTIHLKKSTKDGKSITRKKNTNEW